MINIYEYKGGGYDGCHWEWNFFALEFNEDRDATFHNILSTGRKGLKSYEEFQEKVQSEAWVMSSKLSMYSSVSDDQMFEFVDGMSATNAKRVDWYLREHDLFTLKGHCWECGDVFDVEGMNEGPWQGDGGIGIYSKDLFCLDCARKRREDADD